MEEVLNGGREGIGAKSHLRTVIILRIVLVRSVAMKIVSTYKFKRNSSSLGSTNGDVEEDPRALYSRVRYIASWNASFNNLLWSDMMT